MSNEIKLVVSLLFCVVRMCQQGSCTNLTGYGPRRMLIFDGNESKYELWEVKFLGYMRLQKLYDEVIPKERETTGPNAEKLASAFAELVQCLDNKSLFLVIREARQ